MGPTDSSPISSPTYDLEACRRDIPILRRAVPLNNCSQAPMTVQARAAMESYLDSWNREGMDWDLWMGEVDRARFEFARLIGAATDDVAVFSSVSHATAAVASALDYSERSSITVTQAEFPTVAHVWLAAARYGAEHRWVPVEDGRIQPDAYHGRVDERTLLLSACHGYYQTGFKQDLGHLGSVARSAGALLYVDAYQTLGTHPVDVTATDIDFLASGNLKFLMGVPGIAFLYVNPDLVTRLEPAVTGWFGRDDPYAFRIDRLDWAPGARRFDTGTPPIPSAYIARAGMEVINEIGSTAIARWTQRLSQALVEGGRDRGLEVMGPGCREPRTPTVAFRVEGDSHVVEERMRRLGIIASARGPAVRLAPHYYTTFEDVERGLDALASSLQ